MNWDFSAHEFSIIKYVCYILVCTVGREGEMTIFVWVVTWVSNDEQVRRFLPIWKGGRMWGWGGVGGRYKLKHGGLISFKGTWEGTWWNCWPAGQKSEDRPFGCCCPPRVDVLESGCQPDRCQQTGVAPKAVPRRPIQLDWPVDGRESRHGPRVLRWHMKTRHCRWPAWRAGDPSYSRLHGSLGRDRGVLQR